MNVKINHLKKYYQDKLILDIENLEIIKNQTYCIRGRNGSGKTTLMQVIAQLLPFDSGEILFEENDFMEKMTYVSQNPYLFHTTVYENIYYPLKLRDHDKKRTEIEINDYLDYFEISHIKNQNAKKCSSGEKMKIAIIRSLIFKPKLLLLDEPTTNLDIESIEKLKNKLIDIKNQTTIIFISHDIHFIKAISDVELRLEDAKLEIGDHFV